MTQTTARIRKEGKHFEIRVNMDAALAFKKGQGSAGNFLESDVIFTDAKKGERASSADLENAFGTSNPYEVAEKIVKNGDIEVTQEHRSAEQEAKIKQVVDFLVRNAIDPRSGNPYTPDRIKSAIDEAHINIKNVPVENQISEILEKISSMIPIKVETKKIKITIPAMHTGRAYGVIAQGKESENWLNNGDLEVIIKIPAGTVLDFYDKLNSVTHGSALTEEIKSE